MRRVRKITVYMTTGDYRLFSTAKDAKARGRRTGRGGAERLAGRAQLAERLAVLEARLRDVWQFRHERATRSAPLDVFPEAAWSSRGRERRSASHSFLKHRLRGLGDP